MEHRQNSLLDGIEALLGHQLEALLPLQYAAYRPVLAGGLRFFLARLDSPRLAAIIEGQLRLPSEAGAPERLVALLHHCPTLHKLGQLVARDRRLDSGLRQRLQTLESLPPPLDNLAIRRTIRGELADHRGIRLETALAAGSVALVVPFACTRADCPVGEGVFKLLKPGIESRLAEELEIWSALGGYLEERCTALGLAAPRFGELFDSVRALLAHEVRLDTEQTRLGAAGERYRDLPAVHVPAVLPLSTPRLLAMERIHGVKLTEASGQSPRSRRRLAATVIEAMIARPYFGAAGGAVFHADPHAGNLFRTDDGRLAILDWSLTTELSRSQREALLRIVLAALSQDPPGLCDALAALGCRPQDPAVLRDIVDQALAEVRRGRFPGLDWGLALIDRLAARGTAAFPGELVLLRKALLALQGVLADLDPGCPADLLLTGHAITRLIAEMPARACGLGGDPGFGFPLDTVQLMSFGLGLPGAAMRYWQGHWFDWAGRWQPALAGPGH